MQNSPFGIGAPKGTPAAVVKRLHDAFKQAMEQETYRTTLARYDMVPMYMSSAQYQKFAGDTFAREKALVEKLGLANRPEDHPREGEPFRVMIRADIERTYLHGIPLRQHQHGPVLRL